MPGIAVFQSQRRVLHQKLATWMIAKATSHNSLPSFVGRFWDEFANFPGFIPRIDEFHIRRMRFLR